MKTELTEAVRKYHQYQIDLKSVVDMIAVTVYTYPPMRNQWDEDQCSDFLCHFYARIPPMIERFRYHGSPFESLLKVTLRFQMKSYAMRVKKKQIENRILENRAFLENALMMETRYTAHPGNTIFNDEYTDPSSHIHLIKKDEGLKKRLLMLLMKESSRISESFLVHFVTVTGYDRDWVEDRLDRIREITVRLERKKEICRKRKNRALFDIYCIHDQLRCYPTAEERDKLLYRLKSRTRTLRKAEETMNRVPAGPTHQQISSVLGIPKGTVDSGLHYMSRKYNM